LDHLWSLAIEEQFYLVWPWLLMIGIWTARSRRGLAIATLALAAASALAMSLLFHPGYDPTRVYEGTDTRAFALLIGAALAMVWPSRPPPRAARPAIRTILDAVGAAGLVAIVLLIWRTESFSSFLYPWGFVLLALATGAVVAAVVVPTSRLGPILGCRPLRFLGVRSYGIYLWHWPIIVLTGPQTGSVSWVGHALQVAATIIVAAVSWRYVEDPIRHGLLGRTWQRVRAGAGWVGVRRRALTVSGTVLGALVIPVVSLAGVLPVASGGKGRTSVSASSLSKLPPAREASAATSSLRAAAPASSTRSSCRSVVYLGDSTSEGSISTDYIPNPRLRLEGQLADVGATRTLAEISGARSIVETYQGQPNAATVAKQHVSQGYKGCWILALGTNEADNVYDSSPFNFTTRVNRMMAVIGSQPVLWVSSISLLSSGGYSNDLMKRWNHDLEASCPRYPNLRVFDWASRAQPRWFIADGIHYTSPGYVARTHLIARALATAFPANGRASPGCVVQ
jgi:hypothetical protein